MFLKRPIFLAMQIAVLVIAALFAVSCSDDDSSTNTTIPAGDYFPFGREYQWTYTSNILAERGTPVIDFQMKIDTATEWNGSTNRGLFWFIMIRPVDLSYPWGTVVGLLDSGNVIYGLGDHPPEGPYPLFKHAYVSGEATAETITVQGHTYNAARVDMEPTPGVIISWWFAPGVGLIKEYSEQGASIFTDDQWGKDVVMNTELVSFEKIQ